MTVLTRPFHQGINQYCSINSFYAANKWPISGEYTQKRSSVTKFWPTGSVFKNYYAKPIEDRTISFALILLICNDVYGINTLELHMLCLYCLEGGIRMISNSFFYKSVTESHFSTKKVCVWIDYWLTFFRIKKVVLKLF